jgi:hypothetical protein
MNARRCLKIATRIGSLLEQEVGLGVDAKRMLTERLYMRDVLLVCDAHRGSELSELATWFRRSAAEAPDDGIAPSGFGMDSGFGHSGFGAAAGGRAGFGHSGFGSSSFDSKRDPIGPLPTPALLLRQQLEHERATARRAGWLSAVRWVGR